MKTPKHAEVIRELREYTQWMTQWERDFLRGCYQQFKLSDKQEEIITRLAKKYFPD